MELTLKTKEVSEQLGVNPTTVQRWAKYFGLNCETNEYGHYLFSVQHVELMKEVQQQLQAGKMMKEVDISSFTNVISTRKKEQHNVHAKEYEAKLDEVLIRVEQLEERLSRKADEVVSYQLLKHRAELEDMTKLIKKLEKRLAIMEEKIEIERSEKEMPLAVGAASKKKWRIFMQLFSF